MDKQLNVQAVRHAIMVHVAIYQGLAELVRLAAVEKVIKDGYLVARSVRCSFKLRK